MKERRKRRSAKDIEESILDAANQLIENRWIFKIDSYRYHTFGRNRTCPILP